MKHIAAAIIALTIFIFTGCGQRQNENETIGRIDDYLSKLEAVGFHGAVLVGRTGEVLVSKGYGFSNSEKLIKNSPSQSLISVPLQNNSRQRRY